MRFSGLSLAIILLLASVVACRWSKASENTNTSTQTSSAPTPDYSLDSEAAGAVKDFWEQHYTQCGENSYIGLEDDYPFVTYHQYKGVSFMARSSGPINEADRLNGVLWKGSVKIYSGPYRERPKDGQWGPWKQNQNLVEEVGATKRAAGWSVTQVRHITVIKKVNCNDVE